MYSEKKSFIVKGSDTYKIKDIFKKYNGTWNREYEGWIFDNKNKNLIKKLLKDNQFNINFKKSSIKESNHLVTWDGFTSKNDCRPTIMVEWSNPKTKKRIKKKVLIDTGAVRSAISKIDSDTLKLKKKSTFTVSCGTGQCKRSSTDVLLTVNDKKYELNPTIRENNNLNHSILGTDWILQSKIDLNKNRPVKCKK